MTKNQYIKQLNRFTHIHEEDVMTLMDECEIHGIEINVGDWVSGQDDCIYFPEIEHAVVVWE
jgi:hypothetical protein